MLSVPSFSWPREDWRVLCILACTTCTYYTTCMRSELHITTWFRARRKCSNYERREAGDGGRKRFRRDVETATRFLSPGAGSSPNASPEHMRAATRKKKMLNVFFMYSHLHKLFSPCALHFLIFFLCKASRRAF